MEELKKKLEEVYSSMTPEAVACLSDEEIASLKQMLETIQEMMKEEN